MTKIASRGSCLNSDLLNLCIIIVVAEEEEFEEEEEEEEEEEFTTTGGAGPAASVFLKHLGSKIAEKKDAPYSQTIGWLRCRLWFALLLASILRNHGSRSLIRSRLTHVHASLTLLWPKAS